MNTKHTLHRYHTFKNLGISGKAEAVDQLMAALTRTGDLATSKMVDFALSLVDSRAGKARLRHYLFHGEPVQRNYAALYFKRRGINDLLEQAVASGLIDQQQAFSK